MEEKKMTDSKKRSPLIIFFVFSVMLLIGVVAYSVINPRNASDSVPAELLGVLRPEPKSLAPIKLIGQDGTAFSMANISGKWSFVFFGYTYCPDVCPMTLSMLKAVDKHLDGSGNAEDTQVLFVSVDPERDTPEKLAEYIAFFNKDFLAATGEKIEIDKFAQQLGAGYIIDPETVPGVYEVSHTSAIFLIDPQARLVATFSQPHNPENIVQLYFQIRDYFK